MHIIIVGLELGVSESRERVAGPGGAKMIGSQVKGKRLMGGNSR